MNLAEEFKKEMKELVFHQKMDKYGDIYRTNVTTGVIILFKFRDLFNNKTELMNNFLSIKKEIIEACNDDILIDDFTDELYAVLINYYSHNMPDFGFVVWMIIKRQGI